MLATMSGCTTISLSTPRPLAKGKPRLPADIVETAPLLDHDAAQAAVARLDAQRNETQCEQALAVWKQGRAAEAEQLLEQVLQRNPRHATARRLLADMALEQGRGDEAERLLVKLVEENPSDEAALTSLAWLYESQDKTEEAEAIFQRLKSPNAATR
jgi:tetratricopeptide (TPR) repeat protein